MGASDRASPLQVFKKSALPMLLALPVGHRPANCTSGHGRCSAQCPTVALQGSTGEVNATKNSNGNAGWNLSAPARSVSGRETQAL